MTSQAETALQPTPGGAWRELREVGTVTQLKSTERVICYRPVDLLDALEAGEVPDPLTEQVLRVAWDSTTEDKRTSAQRAKDWIALLNLVAKLTLIHPVVSDDPQGDDEILPKDLSSDERKEIYDLATQPIEQVLRFRAEQTGDVGRVSQGDDSGEAAA